MSKLLTTIATALLLTGGCDDKPAGGDKKAQAKAPAKPSEAKKDAKKPADAKNPHAGMGSNPHAGMNMKPAEPAKGPPRDITPSGEAVDEALKELTVSMPKEWEKGTPSSRMRLAQWVIPGPGGDAELVVSRFPGGAGGLEPNLKRWKGMFTPPEGKTLDDITKVRDLKAGKLKITHVNITGHFVAAVKPGEEAKHDEANYQMLVAMVEGTGDPFFFKAVGPEKTVALWADAYEKMLTGAKVVKDDAKADTKADAKADTKADAKADKKKDAKADKKKDAKAGKKAPK